MLESAATASAWTATLPGRTEITFIGLNDADKAA
jgi:hypothetical protein